MKLTRVEITNFRSIEYMELGFDPSCQILVGINESGKSNILKALSLLGERSPVKKDKREALPNEKTVEESLVEFYFELELPERAKIYNKVKERILAKDFSQPVFKRNGRKISWEEACRNKKEGTHVADISSETKTTKYYRMATGYELVTSWKKPSEACPPDFTIDVDKEKKLLKDFAFVNSSDFAEEEIPSSYLEEVDARSVDKFIGGKTVEVIKSLLPKVIFWEYNEENLLPSSVDINAFADAPDSCVPLKNMFLLAGIEPGDIRKEIDDAKSVSETRFRNLLNRVATATNKHFNSVWKEYKGIKFSLEPNGEKIQPHILEKNHWEMQQRSDGVKRFFAFLLHISANVKANVLTDALILVDEPDVSLHPTGARHLLQELINISSKNRVIFSTHSIFMIDKDNIGRHLMVKKDKEKTTVTIASKSNITDEEVLYNALNISVFDILPKDSIIFEGWRDKKLFEVAIKNIPTKYKKDLAGLSKILKDIGFCHAEGVKDISRVTPILELAGRKCIIVSDNDNAAQTKQKEYQAGRGYGAWYRYDEISPNCSAKTGEDFLSGDSFYFSVEKVLKQDPNITFTLPRVNSDRVEEVKKFLARNGIPGDRTKLLLNEIKGNIFDSLKGSEIDDSYFEFLKDLLSVLEKRLK